MLRNAVVPVSVLIQFVAYLLTFIAFTAAGKDYYAGSPTGTQLVESVRAYPLVVSTSFVPPVLFITAIPLAWWLYSVLKTRRVNVSGWKISAYVSAGILGTLWGTWCQFLMSGASRKYFNAGSRCAECAPVASQAYNGQDFATSDGTVCPY